ncbi:MAG TPA: hypothetical protein VFV39_05075 [Limnobacter sp.]|nr:hypothetical protein [Limnobacter sp.]
MSNTNTQISVTLDRELVQAAKALAARQGTTLSALIAIQMRNLIDSAEQSRQIGNQNYTVLLHYSLGLIDVDEALTTLGVANEVLLERLLQGAGLPKPKLTESQILGMVNALRQLAE